MATYPVRLKSDPRFRVEPDGTTTDLVALDPDARTLVSQLPPVSSGDVDLSSYMVDMNQLSLQACAGNATCESVEILNNIAGYKKTPLSRLFTYNMARQETGELAQDAGTYIRVCFDTLSRFGVCDEYLWPYDTSKVFTSPSLMAQRQAVGHKIHGYYRIQDTGNPNDRIQAIVDALRANHPVVFGTQVSYDFMNLGSGAPPQVPPTGNIAGGHAMCCIGFSASKGFLVKNSWGPSWGDNGLCFFTPDYMAWNQTQDLWVPTLGVNFATAAA